jgi:hypothetical protein
MYEETTDHQEKERQHLLICSMANNSRGNINPKLRDVFDHHNFLVDILQVFYRLVERGKKQMQLRKFISIVSWKYP